MPSLSIEIHYGQGPAFETSDAATVEVVRASLDGPQSDTWLVPARALADTLKACGRKHWASVLEGEEEAHVVTVRFE